MKKTISILMAIICMFTLMVPAFAEAAPEPETIITEDINNEIENDALEMTRSDVREYLEEEMVAEPIEAVTSLEFNADEWGDKPVARVYLCTTVASLFGHVWLYFINLTPYELPLGYVTLQPYEEMSVGSLRNSRTDGGGTYYNGEAYMAGDLNKVCKNTVSSSMEISYDQLLTMGNKIKSRNSYIVFGNNCGDFACSVWNTVAPAGKKVVNILVPWFTILVHRMAGGRNGQIKMKRPDISRCFKQVSGGVKQAHASSFNTSCVNL